MADRRSARQRVWPSVGRGRPTTIGLASILCACLLCSVLGCGQQARPLEAAAVGDAAIREQQVSEWTGAFAAAGRDELDVAADADARKAALGFLIRSLWLEREAKRRGLRLDRAAVERAVGDRMRQFPTHQAFRRYLLLSGMSATQFRRRVRRDALARMLMEAVISPDLRPSPAEVGRFYRRHFDEFREPRTRDLRTVVTRSRAAALLARAELVAGRSWEGVVAERSVDASARMHGRISIDSRNVISKLRRAVFAAPLGRVTGPLEVRGSWWVFRVDRHRPARQLTLAEAERRITTAIRSEREQAAMDHLMAHVARRYRPETVCKSGYVVPECRTAES